MRTSVAIRGFEFDVDEPTAVGGKDTAPTPMEFVIGALNACLGVVLEKVADELSIPIERIETYAIATQDTRGFEGTATVQPFFHACRVAVHVQTPVSDTRQLQTLRDAVEDRCPALNLIRSATVDVDLTWRFAERITVGAAEIECNRADALARGLAAGASGADA